jgi:nitrite reductase/ring-hydroxylating ferredoxin subunit
LRTALELRAARPGADLHRRLTAELGTWEPGEEPSVLVLPRVVGRRRLLAQGVGLAAASAAVGAAVGHALTDRESGAPGSCTLTPTTGAWQTVAASAELPEGAVRAFDLGTVAGFVHRADGVVRAVSGSCTHQGCRLALDAAKNLDCPCHTTVFALSGELVTHQLPLAPPPLPQFTAREVDGAVQVYAPAAV